MVMTKDYYRRNKKRLNKMSREYHQKNKEKCKALSLKYYYTQKILYQKLKINGCAICGYIKNIGILEFHHTIPEDKLFKINAATFRRTEKSLINELNKCILLCPNCHREIHYEEDL